MARVPPYTALAPVYDQMMGEVAAPVIWQAFCESCAHFGISFRLAADVGCGTGASSNDLLNRDAVSTA